MLLKVPASDGLELTVDDRGEGPPIVLLHGLTATREYVVLGSEVLEDAGHRVIAYDARAHGDSPPAPDPSLYTYERLEADLAALMDNLEFERAVLAGVSMGAHTALRYAIHHPERVAGVAVLTPGFDPDRFGDPDDRAMWDRWAHGMRTGGVKGFLEAYRFPDAANERAARAMRYVLKRRLRLHQHTDALGDAIYGLARSAPYRSVDELAAVEAPSVILATHDDYDLDHPYDVARRYAAVLGCEIVVEDPGDPPLAFRGDEISDVILQVAESGARASAS